ncbi:MAG: GNAT family N-acetyltransferase [Methylohalobius sp. ZOD2]|nr:GNAT family N-acetyltransferase [Methylothermaceae bacterium]
MMQGMGSMPEGLGLRPVRDGDRGFLENLYRSTREDLRLLDGEEDFIEELIEMQYRALKQGYGDQFPNAMQFIIEKQGERIGQVAVDFGPNEVRIINLSFIPKARGKGFGAQILRGMQMAAAQVRAPLALTVQSDNLVAKCLYLNLGFQVAEVVPPYERMLWYPSSA